MKVVGKSANTYALVFDRGEEVIETLTTFCREEGIRGGTFTAIGAAKDTTLAYFDRETKEYLTTEIGEIHELASCIGNVSLKSDGNVFVHAHGVLGDRDMNARAGHIMKMTTAVTCELFFQVFPELSRSPDEEIGLEFLGT